MVRMEIFNNYSSSIFPTRSIAPFIYMKVYHRCISGLFNLYPGLGLDAISKQIPRASGINVKEGRLAENANDPVFHVSDGAHSMSDDLVISC